MPFFSHIHNAWALDILSHTQFYHSGMVECIRQCDRIWIVDLFDSKKTRIFLELVDDSKNECINSIDWHRFNAHCWDCYLYICGFVLCCTKTIQNTNGLRVWMPNKIINSWQKHSSKQSIFVQILKKKKIRTGRTKTIMTTTTKQLWWRSDGHDKRSIGESMKKNSLLIVFTFIHSLLLALKSAFFSLYRLLKRRIGICHIRFIILFQWSAKQKLIDASDWFDYIAFKMTLDGLKHLQQFIYWHGRHGNDCLCISQTFHSINNIKTKPKTIERGREKMRTTKA